MDSKTSFPGAARQNGIAFAVGSFGYVGLGATDVDVYNDMYLNTIQQMIPGHQKQSYPDADGRYAILSLYSVHTLTPAVA